MEKNSEEVTVTDSSNNISKQAMIEEKKKQITLLVCRQTNYSEEEAKRCLEKCKYNYISVIKNYMKKEQDNNDTSKAKTSDKEIKSVNQEIFSQIRTFMDNGVKKYERNKRMIEMYKQQQEKQQQQKQQQEQQNTDSVNKKI